MFPQTQPSGALARIAAQSLTVGPMPLPAELRRDPKDNEFLAVAAASQAADVVTQDRDPPALQKLFGILGKCQDLPSGPSKSPHQQQRAPPRGRATTTGNLEKRLAKAEVLQSDCMREDRDLSDSD